MDEAIKQWLKLGEKLRLFNTPSEQASPISHSKAEKEIQHSEKILAQQSTQKELWETYHPQEINMADLYRKPAKSEIFGWIYDSNDHKISRKELIKNKLPRKAISNIHRDIKWLVQKRFIVIIKRDICQCTKHAISAYERYLEGI